MKEHHHPSTSVIILNWNGEDMLRRYLPAVLSTTDSSVGEVIVADNGSTDGSVDFLAAEFPQVRVLCLDRNCSTAMCVRLQGGLVRWSTI